MLWYAWTTGTPDSINYRYYSLLGIGSTKYLSFTLSTVGGEEARPLLKLSRLFNPSIGGVLLFLSGIWIG